MIIKSFFLAVLVSATTILTAQTNPDNYSIYFKTGTVTPEENASAYLDTYSEADENPFS